MGARGSLRAPIVFGGVDPAARSVFTSVMAIFRSLALCLIVGVALSLSATDARAQQCRAKQRRNGEKILRNLACVQAELPAGPQGPSGPSGPPGPAGLGDLAYADAALNVFGGFFDCVSAQCEPKDRIVGCDAANFDPVAQDVDPSTVTLTALSLRDPEDDTSADVLAADTCLVCYANYNETTTVQILARAVCAVGAKIGKTSAASMAGPRKPLDYDDYRQLTRGLFERSLR